MHYLHLPAGLSDISVNVLPLSRIFIEILIEGEKSGDFHYFFKSP